MIKPETKREQQIWDTAVRKCIKITVEDAGGSPGPQYYDMESLLYEDWDENGNETINGKL